jgi:hypothetical protein
VANGVVSRAKDGYPELGLPVMDPLLIDKMTIDQGGNGPVTLKISLKDTTVRGLAGTVFTKIEGLKEDFNRAKIELRFKLPVMTITGPYKMNGRVLVLPVQGNGIANISLCKLVLNAPLPCLTKLYFLCSDDVDSTMKLLVKQIDKNGKKFVEIEKAKLNFEVQK